MITPSMYFDACHKANELTEDNERLAQSVIALHQEMYARDATIRALADLLRQSVYFVPAGLLRDRIEAALVEAG